MLINASLFLAAGREAYKQLYLINILERESDTNLKISHFFKNCCNVQFITWESTVQTSLVVLPLMGLTNDKIL